MSKTIEEPIEEAKDKRLNLGWLISCAAITALAVALRFIHLGLKPFHHDEGVNGWFLTNLFREGVYKYDPENYHGPTLYYITLGFVNVFGLETVPVRWSVAIWGVLMVVLAFWLRRYIGKTGALFAGLFLALSPGMVYISRYFIHEIFFVFLALAVVVAILQFIGRDRAGPFAVGWISLILMVCFLPSTIYLSAMVGTPGSTSRQVAFVLLFALEAALVFLVVRMLLTWQEGRPIYLLLAASSVSLIFATKETGFITLGTMLIAIGCVIIWQRLNASERMRTNPTNRLIAVFALPVILAVYKYELVIDGIKWFSAEFINNEASGEPVSYFVAVLAILTIVVFAAFTVRYVQTVNEPSYLDDPSFERFNAGMGNGIDLVLILLSSAVAFIYIWIIFFTSFFTYPEGVGKSIEAYAIWTKTGTKDHTQNGEFAYLRWMMEVDAPLLIMSTLGLLIALLFAKHRFAIFVGLWALGLFLGYSIIPYKTPWLMLSFTLPMCIAAGYAINELASSKELWSRVAAGVLGILSCVILAWQTYDLNFVRYDDERMPYVYAHTDREFLDMVNAIEEFAELSGKGKEAKVQIVSPDYWPLTWYLRDYKNTAFHGRMASADGAEVIVAKKNQQEAEVSRTFGGEYQLYGTYKLRPGVELVLLVRNDLAKVEAKGN